MDIPLIVIGLIMVVVGVVLSIWIIYALGAIALVVGVVLLIVHALAGRRVQ